MLNFRSSILSLSKFALFATVISNFQNTTKQLILIEEVTTIEKQDDAEMLIS